MTVSPNFPPTTCAPSGRTCPLTMRSFWATSAFRFQPANKTARPWKSYGPAPDGAEVNGIWGGYTGAGFKTVLPGEAHAKVSFPAGRSAKTATPSATTSALMGRRAVARRLQASYGTAMATRRLRSDAEIGHLGLCRRPRRPDRGMGRGRSLHQALVARSRWLAISRPTSSLTRS